MLCQFTASFVVVQVVLPFDTVLGVERGSIVSSVVELMPVIFTETTAGLAAYRAPRSATNCCHSARKIGSQGTGMTFGSGEFLSTNVKAAAPAA